MYCERKKNYLDYLWAMTTGILFELKRFFFCFDLNVRLDKYDTHIFLFTRLMEVCLWTFLFFSNWYLCMVFCISSFLNISVDLQVKIHDSRLDTIFFRKRNWIFYHKFAIIGIKRQKTLSIFHLFHFLSYKTSGKWSKVKHEIRLFITSSISCL